MKLHPSDQWGGGDVTWAGAQQFDATACFDGEVEFAAAVDFSADATVTIGGDLTLSGIASFAGDVSVEGNLAIGTDLTVTGGVGIDGTSNFFSEADFSNVYLRGDITGSALGVVSVFGAFSNQDDDGNAMLKAHAYLANQDGFVTASVNLTNGATVYGHIGATDDPAGAGTEIARESNTADTGYRYVTFPVAKGKYFELTTTSANAITIYWHPVGVLVKPTDQEP